MGNKTSAQKQVTCNKNSKDTLNDNLTVTVRKISDDKTIIKRSSPIKTSGISGTHIDQLPNTGEVEEKYKKACQKTHSQSFNKVEPMLVIYTKPKWKKVEFITGPKAQKAKFHPEKGVIIRRSHMQSPLSGEKYPQFFYIDKN